MIIITPYLTTADTLTLHSNYQTVLAERKPPPSRLTSKTKVIWDSNPDFQINEYSDPDVCRIAPKMLWIHYVVGDRHFAECREKRSVTVWEMLINLKFPIPYWWWSVKVTRIRRDRITTKQAHDSQKREIGGQMMKVEGQQVEHQRREAPRGWSLGRGVPLPVGEWSVSVCCILGAIWCIFRPNKACTK